MLLVGGLVVVVCGPRPAPATRVRPGALRAARRGRARGDRLEQWRGIATYGAVVVISLLLWLA
jgi:hypothetical protein